LVLRQGNGRQEQGKAALLVVIFAGAIRALILTFGKDKMSQANLQSTI